MVCLCEENHLVHTYSAFLNGGKSNPLFFNEHLIALDMTVKMLCNCLASSYKSCGKKLHKQGVLLSQGWNLKLSSKICVHHELWSQAASDCCRQGQVMISLEAQGFAKMQEYS
ncbi:hypothetical protein CY35_13G101400 [Sphagnum magellanicum]|nr:hypothetical protein CY35_13G101400 [Sphagnum magellanicum]